MVVEAARWASSAGNPRINRFLAVRDPGAIARVRAFSRAWWRCRPRVICTDLERVRVEQVQVERDTSLWMDVGTAA
jgi:hypothetical protein